MRHRIMLKMNDQEFALVTEFARQLILPLPDFIKAATLSACQASLKRVRAETKKEMENLDNYKEGNQND